MQPFFIKGVNAMYPVMLKLKGKRVVIVGGGKVATKKVHKLLEENATIIVVSPTLTEELHTYALNGKIQWIARNFQQEDTRNAFLVIATTNNRKVNQKVKVSCLEGQLVNIVDAPEESNFYNTATIERGSLKIAISTEGASPLLAKKIKRDINAFLEEGYEEYLEFLQEARSKILLSVHDDQRKKYLLQEIAQDIYRKNTVERNLFLQNKLI